MILPIYVYGHPVLRKVAQNIDKDYEGLEKLLKDMWQTMYETDGVGLAAPQIGKSIRLFVIDADPFKDIDPKAEGFKRTFINAEITERGGEAWIMNEGCLSIPLIHEDVKRDETIHIKYYDENWELQEQEFDGMAGRVIQHEYDHIEGILFTDHLPALKRRMLKGRLKDITTGNIDVNYRMRFPK